MKRQQHTGYITENIVKGRLAKLGLIAKKPVPDIGVDFEVFSPEKPSRKLKLQVKGRGQKQRNKKYRWFQIRTTVRQREMANEAGLPPSEAWQKKINLCDYFIFVSEKYQECWVFPRKAVKELVGSNRHVYGNRRDNRSGQQVEINLDIKVKGVPLTEKYSYYLDNFGQIKNDLEIGDKRF
jgi:hypothetical protein